MQEVGVVGTGISGLTLALRLQQLGVPVRLYADQTADQIRNSSLPNTVARFPPTLERERALDVDYWKVPGCLVRSFDVHVGIDPPLSFCGKIDTQQSVDFRVLLPRFLDTFLDRGGAVEPLRAPASEDVARIATRHSLVVTAVGRGSMRDLFPRDPMRSPYDRPQRTLLAGLYTGIDLPPLGVMTYTLVPAVGELIELPMLSCEGMVTALLIEGVPGGPIATALLSVSSEDLPAVATTIRTILERFAPWVAARIRSEFSLRAPRDLLAGALTPIVRKAWASLPDGRVAMAIGDAWITNDPLFGQGANIASHCAWTLAAAIAKGGPFDEAFAARVEDEMWSYAGICTAITNAFLGPPPEHVVALLAAASRHQAIADRVSSMLHYPLDGWALISDPRATMDLVATAAPA